MKQGLLVVVIVALAVLGFWWVKSRRTTAPTTPVVAIGSGSARTTGVPAATQGPARAQITVSDAKGPIANASVRLSGDDGAIAIVTTNTDGIAHAELTPGEWEISASAAGHEPAALPARKIGAGETATLAVKLELGGRPVAGLVTDASGGPIAGARVDAARLATGAQRGKAVAVATTGPDGKYALTIGAGEVIVAVNHPDYAPQQRYAEVGEAGATVDFQLVPGGVIEGRVEDAQSHAAVTTGDVIAALDRGAGVLGEMTTRHATIGADGHFRLTGLRPGAYALTAHAGDLLSATPSVVGIGVAEQVADVVLLVSRGASIRGVVVDDQDRPAPNVTVTTFGGDAEATADAKGNFVLAGLAPGHYGLIARGDDYVWLAATPVELAAKDIDGVKVRVRRGIHVKGRVDPPQPCEVKLELADNLGATGPMFSHRGAQTSADGMFELGPLVAGGYTAHARCTSGDEGSVPTAVKQGMSELVIAVAHGSSIAGRVVDTKGKPVAGASVNAAAGDRTEIVNGMVTSGASVLTAANGTFELAGLAPGTYRLNVLDRGRALPMKTTDAAATIALAASEKKTGVELVVDRPDGVIQGTVTADGKPLADAWVSVDQSMEDMLAGLGSGSGMRSVMIDSRDDGEGASTIAPVLTDAKGHFTITGLPRVKWTVTAEAQAGKLRGKLQGITPDATVTVPIASVRELRGTVHAGTPPAWFAVTLDGPTDGSREFAWADGAFSFARLDPGDYTVKVTSSAGSGEAKVTVSATDNTRVDITLVQNGKITGVLTDAAGKPLPDLPVVAVPDTHDGMLKVQISGPPPTSNAEGRFTLDSKPGDMIVVVMGGHGPLARKPVTVEAGKTIDLGTTIVNSGPPEKP
ncbi:MAG: carboxypeptidase regulatory-like domain-containing protein [Kofleriaceae bacterium]